MAEDVLIRFRGDTTGLTGPLKSAATEAKTLADVLQRASSTKPVTGSILDPNLFKRSADASAAAASAYVAMSRGATQLAGSLGLSYRNALEFSKGLGISASAAAAASDRLAQLDRSGANTVEKFKALKNEFGLTARQFRELNATYEAGTRGIQQLGAALGTNFQAAQQFAGAVGLSATRAAGAIAKYQELSAAGASLANTQRILTQELGLTNEQYKKIAQRAQQKEVGAQASAQVRLGQTTGVSFAAAGQLSQGLGIPAGEAAAASEKLQQLAAAGATTVERFKVLRAEFGLNANQFRTLNGLYEGSIQGQVKLSQALGSTLAGAQKFSQALGLGNNEAAAAVLRYKELDSAGASTAQKFNELTVGLGLTKDQFSLVARQAGISREVLTGLAAIAGGVAAAFGAIAQKGIGEFIEFSGQLTTLGVVAEASEQQMAGIREEITRLGTTTQKAPKEIADLSIELAKTGFNAEQVKASLGGIVLASQATGEGLARTGEVIGSTINQYGLAASDSSKVADLLVVASNKSAGGINDFGEALSYVGTAAAQSNQSLEDTFVALGLMANAGIKGSSAGTGLAEALRRVKLASANAGTEFDQLRSKGSKGAVAAFNQINQAIRDTNGELLPLPQLITNLKRGFATLGAADRDLVSNALFGVQGDRTFRVLLGATSEQLKSFKTEIDNAGGAAKRAGDQLAQGPQAAIARFQAGITTALVRVGELVSTVFLPFIDAGELLVNTFNAMPGPVQAIAVGVAGFVGVLAAATAAVATFNLVGGAKIAADVLSAAVAAQSTVAEIARTAAIRAGAIATGAWNAATLASSVSQGLLTKQITVGAVVEAALTKGRALVAAATTAWAAANNAILIPSLLKSAGAAVAAAAPILPLIGVLTLAVAAIASLAAAYNSIAGSEGSKFSRQIGENTQQVANLNKEAAKKMAIAIDTKDAKKEVENLGDAFNILLKNLQSKGPIEGMQATLATMTRLFDTAEQRNADLNNKFGGEQQGFGPFNGFITSTQLGAQQAQFELEKNAKEIGDTLDISNKLIADAGLNDVSNAKAAQTRLGTDGIAKFKRDAEIQIKSIEAQIEGQKKLAEGTQDAEFKGQIEAQIKLLEKSKASIQSRGAALTGDANALKTNADATREASEQAAKLEGMYKDIEEIVKNRDSGKLTADQATAQLAAIEAAAGSEVALRQKASDAILKIKQDEISAIAKQADQGVITEGEAIAKLKAVRDSSNSPAAAKAAGDAILKIRKAQIDAEIALIQAQVAATEAAREAGTIGEAKAAQEISQLKTQEVQQQIQANQEAQANASGAEFDKLTAEAKKLQAELTKIEAAERKRRNEERLKDFDEVLSQQETLRKKGEIDEGTFADRERQIAEQRADEELRQQREALGKLAADDIEGREAVLTKIGQIEAKKIEVQEKAQTKRLALLKEEQEKAIALVEAAAAERDIATQAAVNQGILSQEQADRQRVDSRRASLEQELAIAREAEAAIAQETATSPDGIKALEREKQQARQKTNQLTLQLLQAEADAQEKLRAEVIAGIDLQLSKKLRGFDAELQALAVLRQERDRNTRSIEAAGQQELAALANSERALNRKSQLLSAQASLRQAIADAAVAETQIELDKAKAAGDPVAAAALENDLAQKKRAALIAQQVGERQALTLEIQRAESAAKRAVTEARINELKAQAAVLDAQAAQREQALTDQKAIAEVQARLEKAQQAAPSEQNAEEVARLQAELSQARTQAAQNAAGSAQGVNIAQQQLGLAQETTAQAQADQANESAIAQLKQQTLAITQETALKQFDAAEAARQLAVNLERAKTAQQGLNAAAGSPTAIPSRRRGGKTPAGMVEAAEDGPELIQYKSGGWGYFPHRGLYNLPEPGLVYTAPQTREILGGIPPQGAIATSSAGSSPESLRGAIAQLSRAIKGMGGGTQNNHFEIRSTDDPYRRMAEISAAQQRGRRR